MVDEKIVLENPDALLTRAQAAEALQRLGFPVSPRTLATHASRGRGPVYRRFGAYRVLYRWSDLQDWAHGRLSEPRNSTPEHERSAA